jgi:hypothetical protein
MNSEEVSSFWEFEKRFYAQKDNAARQRPLLLKDVYEEFVAPKLQDMREDWDNLSEDHYYLDPNATKADDSTTQRYESWQIERAKLDDLSEVEEEAHKSFDNCRAMCEEVTECFQFRFQDGICSYNRAFSLGKPKKPESDADQRWMSGWATNKIRAWIQEQQECTRPTWPDL